MKTLKQITETLADAVDTLSFSKPVTHVYNPLQYAKIPHEHYIDRFGAAPKEVILVGMNPGPFGMMQTGVPFGDIKMVSEFLKISAPVASPKHQHPKRPIEGFACGRSEVSGTRLWGYIKEKFKSPEAFFNRFYVANYCPLVFLEEGGKNRTPDKLLKNERDLLFKQCDIALKDTVITLKAKTVLGIGAFAHNRIKSALKDLEISTGTILHPSPASPIANRGWATQAESQLKSLGVL